MLSDLMQSGREVEKLLLQNSSKTDWGREYLFLKSQVKNLQHERLVHLLVTLAVGLAGLSSCLVLTLIFSLPILFLSLILLPLFAAYICHYFKLENTVQSWYPLLKKLKDKT